MEVHDLRLFSQFICDRFSVYSNERAKNCICFCDDYLTKMFMLCGTKMERYQSTLVRKWKSDEKWYGVIDDGEN